MKRSVSALIDHLPTTQESSAHENDPRWRLALEVVAGPHFVRSPLLSRFLLHVVRETLEGRQAEISEHQIGVSVFGRSPKYRTDEDNIVRNYARQLRKRLTEHFATESDGMRIDIPIGGYVPRFLVRGTEAGDASGDLDGYAHPHSVLDSASALRPDPAKPFLVPDRAQRRTVRYWLWFGIYSIALVALTWLAVTEFRAPLRRAQSNDALWNVIFSKSRTTYVVPPDAGFNVLEDMTQTSLPLASYIKGSSLDLPAVPLDAHTDQDLRTQQYTDFGSMKIVASLARLPQFDPQRVLLRFPRDLRIDDLKSANGIIIGSASANPWATLGDSITNFRIVPDRDMRGASIVNARPLPGEAPQYDSHWNEPSHETYALIVLIPNLSGSGNVLLIEGLDVAGTEAAAEALFHPDLLTPILDKARRANGGLRPFEVLLRSTSIQSNAAGAQVVASRIH